MTLSVIGLVLMALIYIGAISFGDEDKCDSTRVSFKRFIIISIIAMAIVAPILTIIGVERHTTERIYKKALLENPYEMVIKYELEDSVMIPTDTIFRLK